MAAVGYCDQVIAASSPSSPSPEKPFSLPATTWLRAGSVSGDSSLAQATLLLLLSRFSRVRLCATSQTAAHQAPPSPGFSRQEHWSGLPFPPMHENLKSESEVAQSGPTLRDPLDCILPGSSVHGVFQARVLEWGAIAFSCTGHRDTKILW